MKIEIPNFNNVRILVIGDVMLDRYWHGSAGRISPEAPVPVLHITNQQDCAGGAGNVALNLHALGCQVKLLGVIGDDHAGALLKEQLVQAGIDFTLEPIVGWNTITKVRVLGRNQQLVRIDFEQPLGAADCTQLLSHAGTHIENVNVLVLSDYAKGALQQIQELIALAKQARVPVLIDPKSKDFSLYRGATLVTPNLKEFEAVVGHCSSQQDIIEKGHALIQQQDIAALLVTQGENGMTLLQQGYPPVHLPTRAREVYDVTGAGDTVIAVMAATMACGESLEIGARLANIAAGLVIRKLGAASVSVPELRRALQRSQGSAFGILTEAELLTAVADARAHGEKIVMTNGCFDILHAGHIQYLEQAKELGHRLVVAINDDESVRRLKGATRPVNSLAVRMAVVSALRAVDWVVPFVEDTPERVITEVKPDILVKGADYQVHQIAGAAQVMAAGGAVRTLPLKPDHSTSAIIKKAREEVGA